MILDQQNTTPIDGVSDESSTFVYPNLPLKPSQIKESVVILGGSSTPNITITGSANKPGGT